jgi:hypothetical protein
MVLVSLRPFAVKRIILVAAAILGLSSAVCFADSLLWRGVTLQSNNRLAPTL